MTAPDRPVQDVIAEVLLNEGATPGSSIHSWRCEYPDRYGPCTCVQEVAAEIVAACREATVPQQAELVGGEVERSDTCAECAERGVECNRSARAVGAWGAP